jgi:selenocysteine-specific elongation factor
MIHPDLLPSGKRDKYVDKAKKLVGRTLKDTRFAGSPMVAVAARPGSAAAGSESKAGYAPAAEGTADLIAALMDTAEQIYIPPPSASAQTTPPTAAARKDGSKPVTASLPPPPFLLYVDHCFAIKGQGTVITGTVVRGTAKVGDAIEIPALGHIKRIRSMQAFRRPVTSCSRGDRVGVCIPQLDASLVERGIACAPGTVPTYVACLAAVERVRFYQGAVKSRGKIHLMVGHSTIMGALTFFGTPDGDEADGAAGVDAANRLGVLSLAALKGEGEGACLEEGRSMEKKMSSFDFCRDYVYQEELYGAKGRPWGDGLNNNEEELGAAGGGTFEATTPHDRRHVGPQWAFVCFDRPVTATADAVLVAARLDADASALGCRIALHGRVVHVYPAATGMPGASSSARTNAPPPQTEVPGPGLRVYKLKRREGQVERVESDGCSVVCKGMFQKDSDVSRFAGMEVLGPGGVRGVVEGAFGKSGKFRARFPGGVAGIGPGDGPAKVTLTFKRYVFDPDKRRMVQENFVERSRQERERIR